MIQDYMISIAYGCLEFASNFLVAGGGFENVLVVGADALSRYVDWTDRGTCILFGDGAGAVVLQVIQIFHRLEYSKQVASVILL